MNNSCFNLEDLEQIYETDDEYRRSFCRFFGMPSVDEIEETQNTAIDKGLDMIHQLTKDDAEWTTLFQKCAATLLTENIEVGICIALSFQHFPFFYNCFRHFVQENREQFRIECEKWNVFLC